MRGIIFALALALPTAVLADPLPFDGKWDCEVAVFTFAGDVFNNGSEDMPITDVIEEDGVYVLSFEDDYQFSISLNADGTLTWVSGASGDSFTCKAMN